MTQHKPLPVAGYTEQPTFNVNVVNENKVLEEHVLRQIDAIQGCSEISFDPRWLSIARTQIEQGFMALNRAVFVPQRIQLPEDE